MSETLIYTIGSISVGFIFVGIITALITLYLSKDVKKMKTPYIHKLSNSDNSIRDAVKHIKLTNSIEQYIKMEKIDE